MFQLLLGHLLKVSLGLWSDFLASLYFFTFFAVSLKLVICLVILYLLTTFVTVSCWKHFNCYHYIIIFVLMAIYDICISWTVFYELLPSISNISLVLVDFLFTSDYLSSVFCRLCYWETATGLEGFIYSVSFSHTVLSPTHFWWSLCICFLPNIFLYFPFCLIDIFANTMIPVPCLFLSKWPFYPSASSVCNF